VRAHITISDSAAEISFWTSTPVRAHSCHVRALLRTVTATPPASGSIGQERPWGAPNNSFSDARVRACTQRIRVPRRVICTRSSLLCFTFACFDMVGVGIG
jgi:hypothetical protein